MPAASGGSCELKSAACSTVVRPRDLPPNGLVIQIVGLFAAAVRTAKRDRGWRRLSWRAQFSAATRTNLASVPDPQSQKSHPSADERKLLVRTFVHRPAYRYRLWLWSIQLCRAPNG